jgi:glycerol-1-phosphate dehydrogenase [NAD(P)+]
MSDILLHHPLLERLEVQPLLLAGLSLRMDIDELLYHRFGRVKFAIVDDAKTSTALGDDVFRALKGKTDCTHITFPGSPKADMQNARWLSEQSARADVLLAVGSGTINDLCKFTSHQQKKPYAVFPTAASMNGYLSANASLVVEGHKTTLPAQMPDALYCDLSVLAAAPARLAKSGLGDSLARSTAQADWLLSHLLLGTPYDDTLFAPLLAMEEELHDSARGIALGDRYSVELLLKNLLLSGAGMTLAGGSYPASQGEHMIAHCHEMLTAKTPLPVPTLHGEEIAITSLYMAQLQEQKLSGKTQRLHERDFPEALVKAAVGWQLCEEFKEQYAKKLARMVQKTVSEKLQGSWQEMAERIRCVHLPAQRIAQVLEAAQCHTSPTQLSWNDATYASACQLARLTRDRFTFLDIA